MQSRPSTSSFFKNSKFLDRRWEDLSLEEQNLLNARLERVNKFLNDAANAKEGKINRLCFMYFRQISPIMVFLTDAPPYPDGPIAMVVQRIVARLMEKVEANPSVLEDFRRLREWEPGLQIGIIPTFSRGKRTKPQEIHWTLEEEDKDFLFSCGIHSTVPPPESLPASAAA